MGSPLNKNYVRILLPNANFVLWSLSPLQTKNRTLCTSNIQIYGVEALLVCCHLNLVSISWLSFHAFSVGIKITLHGLRTLVTMQIIVMIKFISVVMLSFIVIALSKPLQAVNLYYIWPGIRLTAWIRECRYTALTGVRLNWELLLLSPFFQGLFDVSRPLVLRSGYIE